MQRLSHDSHSTIYQYSSNFYDPSRITRNLQYILSVLASFHYNVCLNSKYSQGVRTTYPGNTHFIRGRVPRVRNHMLSGIFKITCGRALEESSRHNSGLLNFPQRSWRLVYTRLVFCCKVYVELKIFKQSCRKLEPRFMRTSRLYTYQIEFDYP